MRDEILRLEGVSKAFDNLGGEKIVILSSVDLTLYRGETVAILGKSGSGKSTLLALSSSLLPKDGGKIFYFGNDADEMKRGRIEDLRLHEMGFVFQEALLMEDFSALENVMMPLLIRGEKKRDAKEKALEALSLVSLYERRSHRPAKLSGGERERVSIARALVSSPSMIFADEPTGSLDELNARLTEDLLLGAVKKRGAGMLLVTHNRDFASRADRMVALEGGRLGRL